MMSEKINVKKVEKELIAALAADLKYQRENDAKIRAVTQKVASYEEFREIVKGSHLRPLDQKDMRGGGGYSQPWNPAAGRKDSEEGGGGGGGEGGVVEKKEVPQNSQSFLREWRQLKQQSGGQYRLLLRAGANHLQKLFRVEISMGLLGEIVTALCQDYDSEDGEAVFTILLALSQSSRFTLAVKFLNRQEKQNCQELFALLLQSDSLQDKTVISELRELYIQ